jgi:hypothetical protein
MVNNSLVGTLQLALPYGYGVLCLLGLSVKKTTKEIESDR